MVQKDGEMNGKIARLFPDGVGIVVGVGIDEPENHSFRGELFAQGFDFRETFLDDRTTRDGEDEDNCAGSVLAVQFAGIALVIAQDEVLDF
jgi:hypothetical protein